ncbi:hypothetical protein SMICM17S_13127 [Streptomyces microflavus]
MPPTLGLDEDTFRQVRPGPPSRRALDLADGWPTANVPGASGNL